MSATSHNMIPASAFALAGALTFGRLPTPDKFALMYKLVVVLVVRLLAIGSYIVRLQERVTKVEIGQQAHDTGTLNRQVKDLCEMVASQQEHIEDLKQGLIQQRAEANMCHKKVEKLALRFDDDGREFNKFVEGLHST
ncbi:hypothetical protein HYDPIDRAFT_171246, partial [Hydnomerulius pinastri MD-312]